MAVHCKAVPEAPGPFGAPLPFIRECILLIFVRILGNETCGCTLFNNPKKLLLLYGFIYIL